MPASNIIHSYDQTTASPRSHSAEVNDAYAEINSRVGDQSERAVIKAMKILTVGEMTLLIDRPPGELLSLTQVY